MAATTLPLQRTADLQLLLATDFFVHSDSIPEKDYVHLKPIEVTSTKHRPGQPFLSFTVEHYLSSYSIDFRFKNITTDDSPKLLEIIVTRSDPETEDDEKQRHEWKELRSKDIFFSRRSPNNGWVQIVVKVFAPLSTQSTSMVMAGLQRARLEGGVPKCDALLCAGVAELPAHRFVLAACSPVLARMLDGDGHFTESTSGRVDVKDFSEGAVHCFLEYVYTDKVEDWAGLELELLALADKYMMPPLKADCELRLWLADGPRALALLREADGCPLVDAKLRRRWIRTVACGLPTVVKTPEWAVLQEKHAFAAEVILELAQKTSVSTVWSA